MAGLSDDSGRDEVSFTRGLTTAAGAALSLRAIAEAALAALAHSHTSKTDDQGKLWEAWLVGSDGPPIGIALRAADVPVTVPQRIAPPELIPAQRAWAGTHRLVVRAPLIVFDLSWTPGEPLRIMTFSRGDWESALISCASTVPAMPN